MNVTIKGIIDLARSSEPFDPPPAWTPPEPGAFNDAIRADWIEGARSVAERIEATQERKAAGVAKLNKVTLDFIRGELIPEPGTRAPMLFSTAANLAEFGCPPMLAAALLTGPGRDCGLPPSEVDRQIRCGLEHVGPVASPEVETAATTPEPPPQETATAEPATNPSDTSEALREALMALWANQTEPATTATEPAAPTPSPDRPIPRPLTLPAVGPGDMIEAEPNRPGYPLPDPPADARLIYFDGHYSPCRPTEAVYWTWEGGPRFYRVADCPPPTWANQKGGPV